MNPWIILGIDPTHDPLIVKRAYTRKLREFPPESDPDGFQKLRTAYERALILAKLPENDFDGIIGDAGGSETFEGEPMPPNAPDAPWMEETESPTPPAGESQIPHGSEWHFQASALFNGIITDFPDHSKRQFDDYWRKTLEDPVLWHLDAKAWVSWNLFGFLGAKLIDPDTPATEKHIGRQAWIVIDDTFGWLIAESELYRMRRRETVDLVLDPIREARGQRRSVDIAVAKDRYADLGDIRTESGGSRYRFAFFLAFRLVPQIFHFCSDESPTRRSPPHLEFSPSQLPWESRSPGKP